MQFPLLTILVLRSFFSHFIIATFDHLHFLLCERRTCWFRRRFPSTTVAETFVGLRGFVAKFLWFRQLVFGKRFKRRESPTFWMMFTHTKGTLWIGKCAIRFDMGWRLRNGSKRFVIRLASHAVTSNFFWTISGNKKSLRRLSYRSTDVLLIVQSHHFRIFLVFYQNKVSRLAGLRWVRSRRSEGNWGYWFGDRRSERRCRWTVSAPTAKWASRRRSSMRLFELGFGRNATAVDVNFWIHGLRCYSCFNLFITFLGTRVSTVVLFRYVRKRSR